MKLTGLRVQSWAALETYVGGLGALLGPMLAVLGRSWALCWRSWAALGACGGGLEPKTVKNLASLEMCLFLEREHNSGGLRGLCWRSWAALGANVGGLGLLLRPMLAVLGCS